MIKKILKLLGYEIARPIHNLGTLLDPKCIKRDRILVVDDQLSDSTDPHLTLVFQNAGTLRIEKENASYLRMLF